MTPTSVPGLVDRIERLMRRDPASPANDAELLERFTFRKDAAAFEAIVWRHGPLVLGVCRRVLDHRHDAEDAFQATFLLLTRKAGRIRKSESLASWLYKVAYRVALRARRRANTRAPVTVGLNDVATRSASEDPVLRELRPLLDGAVQRLPERYRRPVILCYLQGKTDPRGCVSLSRTRWRRAASWRSSWVIGAAQLPVYRDPLLDAPSAAGGEPAARRSEPWHVAAAAGENPL